MPGALIVLGNKTSHKGTALQASPQRRLAGKSACGAKRIAGQRNPTEAV